jgi:transposase
MMARSSSVFSVGGVSDVLPSPCADRGGRETGRWEPPDKRTVLDTYTGAGPELPRRVEVFTGLVGRLRSWSLKQKLAIVAEAESSDTLSELARRHDIRSSQLYTWCRELRYALRATQSAQSDPPEPLFVPIVAEAVGLVKVSYRSPIALSHLGFEGERADAAEI